jgi:hypothetical protein
MGEPVIGAQAFACLVLIIGDQRPAVPILPALEPAKGTFRFIHEDAMARAVDLSVAHGPQLVLLPEGVIVAAPLGRCFGSHLSAPPR